MASSPSRARACALPAARRSVVVAVGVVVLIGAVLIWGGSRARAAGRCTVSVTPSTFASAVSSAAPGATICLASGDYGTWSGTDKAITITPVAGATPQMGISFRSAAHEFTIDGGMASFTQPWGLEISHESSPDISNGASNITIENTNIAVGLDLDSLANSNVAFNHDLFHDLNGLHWTAGLHLGWSANTPSGVTVENSLFRDHERGCDPDRDLDAHSQQRVLQRAAQRRRWEREHPHRLRAALRRHQHDHHRQLHPQRLRAGHRRV